MNHHATFGQFKLRKRIHQLIRITDRLKQALRLCTSSIIYFSALPIIFDKLLNKKSRSIERLYSSP